MSSFLKSLVEKLPDFIQQPIRLRYYEGKISRATIDDEPDLKIFEGFLKIGNVVVDAGANYGIYSKFFSRFVGDSGEVHSFEPIEKTFVCFQNNMKHIGASNVRSYKFALSDKSGPASMEIPDYDEGGENLYQAKIISEEGSKAEKVETVTMDKVLSNLKRLDAVKIDVEGHEYAVLQGGLKMIEKFKPLLLIEINGGLKPSNANANQIRELLSTFGYTPFRRNGEKLEPVISEDDGYNYFFLTNRHVSG